MTAEIENYVAERDEALLSLDEAKIRAMFLKFNGRDIEAKGDVFWGAMHKAITGATSLPIEFRKASKAYLTERGLHSFDDGEL
jgi:hypothetical protein